MCAYIPTCTQARALVYMLRCVFSVMRLTRGAQARAPASGVATSSPVSRLRSSHSLRAELPLWTQTLAESFPRSAPFLDCGPSYVTLPASPALSGAGREEHGLRPLPLLAVATISRTPLNRLPSAGSFWGVEKLRAHAQNVKKCCGSLDRAANSWGVKWVGHHANKSLTLHRTCRGTG